MVIAVANLAFFCNPERRHVAIALGAVGPTTIRCTDSENSIRERIDWGWVKMRRDEFDQGRFDLVIADVLDHANTVMRRCGTSSTSRPIAHAWTIPVSRTRVCEC